MTAHRPYFFPRDRTFWLYQGVAVAVILLFQGFFIFTWGGDQKLFQMVGILVLVLYLTLAMLTFRYHYHLYRWQRLGMGRLVVLVLPYSIGISIVIVLTLLATLLPFSWNDLSSPERLLEENTTLAGKLFRKFLSNLVNVQLYAVAWMFIYIAITTNRRMRKTELHNLKLANSLKDAQLSRLTSQINPHFLFNSLNNIRFMIHENADAADSTITALSEILRYSLESGRQEKVPLGQELTIVKRYLEVMSLQLEGRLQLDLSVPQPLILCQVPPMVLHLLVENAVKHGMEHLKARGALSIKAQDQGERLQLVVSNPIVPNKCTPERNTGTGLANIEQRLRLLYGNAASLAINEDAQNFSASLTLPKEL